MDDGSETASVIAKRITGQVPFSVTIQGTPFTVTSACTECTTTASLSLTAGGGLFVGGFTVAVLLSGIIAIVIM